jgi:hypothetical protein
MITFQQVFSVLRHIGKLRRTRIFCLFFLSSAVFRGQQTPPVITLPVIKLDDALARARQYSGQIQTANLAALLAHEDRVQARAAQLPQISGMNQFIYTEGNGTPSGVFVANDGVHYL